MARFNNTVAIGTLTSTNDREAYNFFRENRKFTTKTIQEKQDFSTALSKIYTKVAEAVIEREKGVFAPTFFYIVGFIYPERYKKLKMGKETNFLFDTNRRVYTILFDNLIKGDIIYKTWDMGRMFSQPVKKGFKDFIVKYNPLYKYSHSELPAQK